MQTPSMAQGGHILEMLSRADGDRVQELIRNWDLIKLLLSGRDLSRLNRESFWLAVCGFQVDRVQAVYVSPRTQLANLERWANQFRWPFGSWEFDQVRRSMPGMIEWPTEADRAWVLVPHIGTLHETTEALLQAMAAGQQRFVVDADWVNDASHLRLIRGIDYLTWTEWVLIDLGGHRGSTSYQARMGETRSMLGHVDVLAAAAHFPLWACRLGSNSVPSSVLAGFQAKWPGQRSWNAVPILRSGRRMEGVSLRLTDDTGPRDREVTIPVRLESRRCI